MKAALSTFFIIALCVIMGACGDDPEGKWDEMKWKSQTRFTSDFPHAVTLDAAGETVIFTCTNYSMMGVDAIDQQGNRTPIEDLSATWYTATWSDNVFILIVPANQTGKSRTIQLYPWSGDVQDSFLFTQPAQN